MRDAGDERAEGGHGVAAAQRCSAWMRCGDVAGDGGEEVDLAARGAVREHDLEHGDLAAVLVPERVLAAPDALAERLRDGLLEQACGGGGRVELGDVPLGEGLVVGPRPTMRRPARLT